MTKDKKIFTWIAVINHTNTERLSEKEQWSYLFICYLLSPPDWIKRASRGEMKQKRWRALRATQTQSCCVAVTALFDLWLSSLSVMLQILRNPLQLEKLWTTPQGVIEWFLCCLYPVSSALICTETQQEMQKINKNKGPKPHGSHKTCHHHQVLLSGRRSSNQLQHKQYPMLQKAPKKAPKGILKAIFSLDLAQL